MPFAAPLRPLRRLILSRLAFFLLGICVVFYMRTVVPISQEMQEHLQQSIPPWLNSSMHLLNELPALNTSALTGPAWGPSPGQVVTERGRRPHHPVVIVPGFISSGLELWEGLKCGKHFFRQRMWGTPAMAKAYFTDRQCWMQHMRLDPQSGLDPPGIKLRAVTGLEAVDWFVPGYFVWGKVIESLGEVGYDANMIHAATYDWRLSPVQLQQRDGYFTRLKAEIETLVKLHGVPVAILAHSYGDQLVRYFLNWVEATEAEGGGGGGKWWTDRHVAVYVDIAGPMLGIPKTVPSLLSGEMRDTALLGQLEGLLGTGAAMAGINPLDRFVSGTLGTVAATFRSWGSLWAMLPRGGVDLWGAADSLGAPDATASSEEGCSEGKVGSPGFTTTASSIHKHANHANVYDCEAGVAENCPSASLQHFLSIRTEASPDPTMPPPPPEPLIGEQWRSRPTPPKHKPAFANAAAAEATAPSAPEGNGVYRNLTISESLELLFDLFGTNYSRNLDDYREVSLGASGTSGGDRGNNWLGRLFRTIGFSSETRSGDVSFGPRPKLTGLRNAAASFGDPLNSPLPYAPKLKIFCLYGVGKSTERAYHYVHRPDQSDRPFALEVGYHGPGAERGVTSVDGDGSIPLVSLGYMCASGWRHSSSSRRLNPAGIKVKIREFSHRALPLHWGGGIQDGPYSGDHVNIMGNHEMIETVLEAVTGHGDEVTERIYSSVMELGDNVHRLKKARGS